MTPDERGRAIRAGEAAAAFYEDHPFEQARAAIMAEWAKTETPVAREALWHELKALERVVGVLKSAAANAKAAAYEMKAEEAQANRKADPYAPA